MRIKLLSCLVLSASVVSGAVAAGEALQLEGATAHASYSLGHQIGEDLQRQGVTFHRDAVLAGLRDGHSGRPGRIPDEEMSALLERLKRRIVQKKVTSRRAHSEALIREGTEFLKENASKPGVHTTESGLQYKVLKPGSGARPGPRDRVRAHYRGRTVDGKEFIDTRNRTEAAEFALDGIITGWSEGIQLMNEGAIYELYIPHSLAYNARGPLAHQTLVFEVELLQVNPESGGTK
ncbi:MAG: FKBP-type peptidyl-prolyl cis-trans isomerase [Deltaproteobacteria bacterium]|jgi:FKBP-type peptidyl-prolyl cis-trans isomerase|nr:FKBP-type peptidyl-prolyl cis-trans isomerase [Deltaproteobacteria bacterium]